MRFSVPSKKKREREREDSYHITHMRPARSVCWFPPMEGRTAGRRQDREEGSQRLAVEHINETGPLERCPPQLAVTQKWILKSTCFSFYTLFVSSHSLPSPTSFSAQTSLESHYHTEAKSTFPCAGTVQALFPFEMPLISLFSSLQIPLA